MTKAEVKAVCESNPQLQWWAMMLFAELSEICSNLDYSSDDKLIANMARSKVLEFPRFVLQAVIDKATKEGADNAD